MRSALFTTALLALVTTNPASALTKAELEDCWGDTANLNGTFTQKMENDAVLRGSFFIRDASQMQMDYERNYGARWVIGGGQLQQTSLKQGDVRTLDHSQDLGPFAEVFSTNPDFTRIVTGTGVGPHHTVVRARHPQAPGKGHIDFIFDNETCRLVQWKSHIDDFKHTTWFRY